MKNFIFKHFVNLLWITLGTGIYSFGFVKLNMANHLAEGGVSGISLIAHFLAGINPSITTLVLNVPLLIIGYRFLGRRLFTFTVYGIAVLAIWIWLWQLVPFQIKVDGDFLIAALLAGIFSGIGLGLVFRNGGTTGGTDIIARLIQDRNGVPLGRTMMIADSFVLAASLSYVDLKHMMYTLICSFVASQVLELVQSGGYTVRGMLIVTRFPEELAKKIQTDMGRGVTFLNGQGGFSREDMKVIYVVLNPREIQETKLMIQKIDDKAFTTIINVHEVMGDFVHSNSRYRV
ncbi:YitT family protein [Lactovum odontotermitis]